MRNNKQWARFRAMQITDPVRAGDAIRDWLDSVPEMVAIALTYGELEADFDRWIDAEIDRYSRDKNAGFYAGRFTP